MKKHIWALLLALLLLPVCAQGDTARDVTAECRFTLVQQQLYLRAIADRNEMTVDSCQAYRDPLLSVRLGTTPAAAVYVEFGRNYMPFEVLQQQGKEWVVIGRSADEPCAQMYASFPETTGTIRLRFLSGGSARTLSVREIYVFSAGERDESIAHIWEQPVEKADIMFIATHPDDEILWFGGAIPTYAGERQKSVEVVYATCRQNYRALELLNGLWHCGVRHYPVIGTFEDFTDNNGVEVIYANWGREKIYSFLVEQLRRFQPEVVVTQDAQGEYGHTQHIALSQSVQRAVELAADPAYHPQSAQQYGVWQVKKLYLHLGDAPTTVMDWHEELAFFGGKTAIEVAREAFDFHQSQNQDKFSVADVGDPYDSTLYTLVFSTVGEDQAGNDFFENISEE